MLVVRTPVDRLSRPNESIVVASILALSFVMRLAAAAYYGRGRLPLVENVYVARALAAGQGYADAFAPGSGPTAHTGPLSPLLLALIFRMLGADSFAAFAAVAMLGVAAVTVSFYLAYLCFREIGLPYGQRIAALIVASLFPFQLSLETTDLIVWEAAYATCALLGVLLYVLKRDKAANLSLGEALGVATLIVILVLLSPSCGLAAAGALGILCLRKLRLPAAMLVAGWMVAFFLLATTPWLQRNERLLGAAIRTRSSFALSFAVGFYDGQLTLPPREANTRRVIALSPHHRGGTGMRLMREAGGEIRYARKLKAETIAWIKRHPAGAAWIAARNAWNFYCPPAWFWDRWFEEPVRLASKLRAAFMAPFSIVAMASLIALAIRRQGPYLYLLAIVILIALPYVMTSALLRYRYPISSLLIFSAFLGAGIALQNWRASRAVPARVRA